MLCYYCRIFCFSEERKNKVQRIQSQRQPFNSKTPVNTHVSKTFILVISKNLILNG